MNFFIFFAFLLIIFNCLAFPNVNASVEDDAFVSLAKGPAYFAQFCDTYGLIIDEKHQNLLQTYEAHLGILYFLRMNWNCVGIMNKLKKETTATNAEGCEWFRKYVFILYEYLFREYVTEYVKAVDPAFAQQIPAVEKPKFELTYRNQNGPSILVERINIKLMDAVQLLASIWRFYFDIIVRTEIFMWVTYENSEKPRLLDEDSLIANYGLSVNSWRDPEHLFDMQKLGLSANAKFNNSYGPLRKIFDYNMEKMMKKTEEQPFFVYRLSSSNGIIEHLFTAPFGDIDTAIADNLFLTFLREGRTNFENFCNKLGIKNLLVIFEFICKNNCTPHLEEAKKAITERFEAYLGIMFLLDEKWQCAQIVDNQKECEKFRTYFDLLYNYFFLTYHEAKHSTMMDQHYAAVRPIFQIEYASCSPKIEPLIGMVIKLDRICAFFFDSTSAKQYDNNLKNFYNKCPEPKLLERPISQRLIEGVIQIGKILKGEEKAENVAEQQHLLELSGLEFGHKLKEYSKMLKAQLKDAEDDLNEFIKLHKWHLGRDYKEEETAPNKEEMPKMDNEQIGQDDQLLLKFLMDRANFEHHCQALEARNALMNIGLVAKRKGKGVYDIGDTVEYLKEQYGAYLSIMYLMRGKWECGKVQQDQLRQQCEKYKNYLDILYDFLFSQYLKAVSPMLAKQFPAFRPHFQLGIEKTRASVIDVMDSLCTIWAFFFDSTYGQSLEFNLENLFKDSSEPKLLNENEMKNEKTIGQKIVENFKQLKIVRNLMQTNESEGDLTKSLIEKQDDEHISEENAAQIQSFREVFDEIIKGMAETTKNIKTDEGFGKKKKYLPQLFF